MKIIDKVLVLLLALMLAIGLVTAACSNPAATTTPPRPITPTVSPSPSATTPTPATTTPTPVPSPTPAPPSSLSSTTSSDVISGQATYDGKTVTLAGQTYLIGSPPRLLIDGTSGVNIAGDIATLEKGFYRLTGKYDAKTNVLTVSNSVKEEANYVAIEAAKSLGINIVPVSIQGLVATPPKEVAKMLTSYLNIPNMPQGLPIYHYVVYTQSGLYLALSDTNIQLPTKFTFLYKGQDYSFTFSAGEVRGILVKTPLEKIDLGAKWHLDEFRGVIIANSIAPLTPIQATVKDINGNPANYAFKRVAITGSYAVTTATVDYSDIKAPMGQGILADTFGTFFNEDTKLRLETIDPDRKTWQLRKAAVTGTVLYPTEQMLKYFDYSAPLTKAQVVEKLKPALIVDTLADDTVAVANISDLNPVVGKPSNYWGKVAAFEGFALGINYPLKTVASAQSEIPVNINLSAVGIADKPNMGSQLAIIGLNNELVGQNGDVIKGKYKFRVAVTQVPEELAKGVLEGKPAADQRFENG